jgi:hypothetical protein
MNMRLDISVDDLDLIIGALTTTALSYQHLSHDQATAQEKRIVIASIENLVQRLADAQRRMQ